MTGCLFSDEIFFHFVRMDSKDYALALVLKIGQTREGPLEGVQQLSLEVNSENE